jgi:hypothetical protein
VLKLMKNAETLKDALGFLKHFEGFGIPSEVKIKATEAIQDHTIISLTFSQP